MIRHRTRSRRAKAAGAAASVLFGLGLPAGAGASPSAPQAAHSAAASALGAPIDGDFDADGIPDQVELLGIRRPDGSMAMDLAALGASPCRKTIVVEIDYMADPDSHHDHRPDDFGGPSGQPIPGLGVPDTTFNDNDHNQLAVGDVNGDGREDILIANDSGGRIDVFDATTGQPIPGLGIPDTTFNDNDHNQLAVGDVNGDSNNRDEILIANDSGGRIDILDPTTPAGAIGEAKAAFAAAPVPALPNCPFPGSDTASGVQLIVDVNGTIPEQSVFDVPTDFTAAKANPNNFDPARDPYVHYNLWVHDYDQGNGVTGSSGLANFPNDTQDFLVSLGSFGGGNGTSREQSGTFMHELGHSLGLDHGGGDGLNYKPNYLSIMNYQFQLTGLTNANTLETSINYSDKELARLDSTQLSESAGVGSAGPLRTNWYDPTGADRSERADGPIDWTSNNFDGIGTVNDDTGVPVAINGAFCVSRGDDGKLTTKPADGRDDVLVGTRIRSGANFICETTATAEDNQDVSVGTNHRFLTGFNDWENLNLRRGIRPGGGAPPREITREEAEEIENAHDQALSPDRKVLLNTPRPGFRTPVLGIAMDERNIYATHFYETIDPPHTADRPGSLVVLDRAILQVRARIPVGFKPRSVAINPATGRIYVLNNPKPATPTVVDLTVIDRGSLSVVTTIPLVTGQALADVAVNSRTNRVYISSSSQGRIHVINGATNAELDPILIGPGPVGMTVDETTNTLYVAQLNRSFEPHVAALGSVTDDGTNRQIHRPVDLGPPHTQPIDVAVDPLNDRIYTANLGGGGVRPSVTVLARRTRTIIKTINLSGPARAITVNPYAHQVFVAGEGGVEVIGEESLSVIRSIPAGLSFAVTTAHGPGRQFYVGDVRSGELTRLSYSSGTRK